MQVGDLVLFGSVASGRNYDRLMRVTRKTLDDITWKYKPLAWRYVFELDYVKIVAINKENIHRIFHSHPQMCIRLNKEQEKEMKTLLNC